jgi:hypothetical protein
VLQEMVLPRAALGWSLFAFNVGVEIGQGCIVVIVAPPLALMHRLSEPLAARVVSAGALAVTVAGGFWFFQRDARKRRVPHRARTGCPTVSRRSCNAWEFLLKTLRPTSKEILVVGVRLRVT